MVFLIAAAALMIALLTGTLIEPPPTNSTRPEIRSLCSGNGLGHAQI